MRLSTAVAAPRGNVALRRGARTKSPSIRSPALLPFDALVFVLPNHWPSAGEGVGEVLQGGKRRAVCVCGRLLLRAFTYVRHVSHPLGEVCGRPLVLIFTLFLAFPGRGTDVCREARRAAVSSQCRARAPSAPGVLLPGGPHSQTKNRFCNFFGADFLYGRTKSPFAVTVSTRVPPRTRPAPTVHMDS